jgi:hypothetical protein
MSEGLSPLTPGWYRESRDVVLWPYWYSVGSHLYILCFIFFTGCGPLTLGWYSVDSHLFPIYQFTGSYILLVI